MYRLGLYITIVASLFTTSKKDIGPQNKELYPYINTLKTIDATIAQGMTVMISNVNCNDNTTDGYEGDDFIEFTALVSVTSGTVGYNVEVADNEWDISPSAGLYNEEVTFFLERGSAGEGDLTIRFTDALDETCFSEVLIEDPGTCGVLDLQDSLVYMQVDCAEMVESLNLGGSNDEKITASIPLGNGDFMLIGESSSGDQDITANNGGKDVWLSRWNAITGIVWSQNYGGSNDEINPKIIALPNGDFLIGATSFSNDQDITGNKGESDVWLARIDNTGNIIWSKNYGSSGEDEFHDLVATMNDEYIVVGKTNASNGDINNNYGEQDAWAFKINETGDIQWSKNFGGTGDDGFYSIVERNLDNYYIAGSSNSSDQDVTENKGGLDGWLLNIDDDGEILQSYSFGGAEDDEYFDVNVFSEGTLIATGRSYSFEGDVFNNFGDADGWVCKIEATGRLTWSFNFGGSDYDELRSSRETLDGNIIVGQTRSIDYHLDNNYGEADAWAIEIDYNGRLKWSQNYGSSASEVFIDLEANNKGQAFIFGNSNGSNIDLNANNGNDDIWIASLEEQCNCNRAADSLALIEFYNATNGPSWTNTWNFADPIDTWFGVSLDGNGCVKCLDLDGKWDCKTGGFPGNNLTGFLPDLDLPHLDSLLLGDNAISGSIPDFSNMPQLKLLWLSDNNLSGPIPDFSALSELKFLFLPKNNLTGSLPSLNACPKLEYYYAGANQLTGSIPDLDHLRNLRFFDVSQNNLSGEIPDIKDMLRLEWFQISLNSITGPIPDFEGCHNMTHLIIGFNELTGNVPDFPSFSKLTNFSASDNNLTGSIPDFCCMPSLPGFSLSDNNLSGPIPDFCCMPSLTGFSVQDNQIEGPLPPFTNAPNLAFVSIYNNQITGDLPDFLFTNELVSINASNNQISGGIANLVNQPKLEALRLNNNKMDGYFPDLSATCPELALLYMEENELTFEDFLDGLENNTNTIAGNASNQWETLNYTPQAEVYVDTVITIHEGTDLSVDLGFDEGIESNVYDWFKNGSFWTKVEGINRLEIENIQPQDAGLYTFEVTNPNAPLLTLYGRTIELVIEGRPFISTWNTENPGASCSSCITIPTNTLDHSYNYDIDWDNDGVFEELGVTGDATHQYEEPGTYSVAIRGDFPNLYHADENGDNDKLTDVRQWPLENWIDLQYSFAYCDSISGFSADQAPQTSLVSNFNAMFLEASSFDQALRFWNLNSITSAERMFDNCGLSSTNYESILNDWADDINLNEDIELGALNMRYCDDSGRMRLIDEYNWNILGDINLCNGNCTVTSSKDKGQGSFREAIICSNESPGLDTILFDIESLNPQVITLESELPQITDACFIDAKTQLQNNNGRIVIEGSQVSDGLSIFTNDVVVQGLTLANFSFRALLTGTQVNNITIGSSLEEDIEPQATNYFYGSGFGISIPSFFEEKPSNILIRGNIFGWDPVEELIQTNNSSSIRIEDAQDFEILENSFVGTKTHVTINNGFGRILNNDIGSYQGNSEQSNFGVEWSKSDESSPVEISNNRFSNCSSPLRIYSDFDTELSENIFICNGSNYLISSNSVNLPDPPEILNQTPGEVSGTSAPNARIELFSVNITDCTNGPDDCQGATFLGFSHADELGAWRITGPLVSALLENESVLATATDTTFKATSNASDCKQVTIRPSFISSWNTEHQGLTCNACISIPTNPSRVYNYDIDWENDGIFDEFNIQGDAFHEYDEVGIYEVAIRGEFPQFYHINPDGDNDKLIDVIQWGETQWTDLSYMFHDCDNLIDFSAADTPVLTSLSNLAHCFRGASNFNAPLAEWVSDQLENTAHCFENAITFDQPLSDWNMTNVINAEAMFKDAVSFNQDLSSWDVSNIREINDFLSGASTFDQSLGGWSMTAIEEANGMLDDCGLSINNYEETLEGWASNSTSNSNITLGANNLIYCDDSGRNSLINNLSWSIIGDAQDPSCICGQASEAGIVQWISQACNYQLTVMSEEPGGAVVLWEVVDLSNNSIIADSDASAFTYEFPEEGGTYTIQFQTEDGCSYSTQTFEIPCCILLSAGQGSDLVTCEGDASIYDLFDFLTNNDDTGSFEIISGAIDISNPSAISIEDLPPGNYSIEYITGLTDCPTDTSTISIKIEEQLVSTLDTTLCFGTSIEIEGVSYAETGDYPITFTNDAGCLETLNLELDFTDEPNAGQSIAASYCEGQDMINLFDQLTNYDPGGNWVDPNGVFDLSTPENFDTENATPAEYTILYTVGDGVCLGDTTLVSFVIHPSETIDIARTICFGDTLEIAGELFTESGDYSIQLNTTENCDSTLSISLQVLDERKETIMVQACIGEELLINGQTILVDTDTPFTEEQLLQSQGSLGCDSTLIIEIQPLQDMEAFIQGTLCGDQDTIIAGELFNAEFPNGQIVLVAEAQNGCDSIVNIDLEIIETFELDSFKITTQENTLSHDFLTGSSIDEGQEYVINLRFDENEIVNIQEGGNLGMYDIELTQNETPIVIIELEICIEACDFCAVSVLEINKDIGGYEEYLITCDGDGINDKLIVSEYISDLQIEYPCNAITIFNRWGQAVYKAQPYDNNWCGTFMNTGNPVPEGTYYFTLDLHAPSSSCPPASVGIDQRIIYGTITLLR